MTEDRRLPDEWQEARDALAPLLELGLVEMVMIDGVENYQITDKGLKFVSDSREAGWLPPKEDES